MRALAIALAAIAAAAPLWRPPTPAPSEPEDLLKAVAGFTPADWAAVERGSPVARIIETDTREIAVAGAVRIRAPKERLVSRLLDVEALKRSAIVLDLGRFGAAPGPGDLQGAPLEDYSLDLRECRVGDCRVRLGAADISRFHQEVAWRAPDWRARAAAVWREVLSGYAAGYLRHGRTALPVFVNKEAPVSVDAELALLAGRFAFVGRYAPGTSGYLQRLGPAQAGADAVLYWSKEDFGVRPVFRISHLVIERTPTAVAAVTTQIYADHYLDAALGLMLAIDRAEGEGIYLVAVNRARTRSLSSLLRRMVRGTVQGRSRDALQKVLEATRSALEKG